ncbi:MAG: N-acetylmuramoyl-L-alanine amidase [Verrucomicrobiia bacterium]
MASAAVGLPAMLLAEDSGEGSRARLTPLAPEPEWRVLDRYQGRMGRAEFERLIREVYSRDGALFDYLDLNDERVEVYRDLEKTERLWTLVFAPGNEARSPAAFRPAPALTAEVRGATAEQPLRGLRIALDPGHLGGDWAQMEERWFKVGSRRPVMEAELNMITCRLLETRLRAAGAEVVWTKYGYQPVTPFRPVDFELEAILGLAERHPNVSRPERLAWWARRRAEALFYRTAEIQARATLLERLRPDLTLCVHFNAAPEPAGPGRFVEVNRLVVFVLGSFMREELVFDDMKFALFRKLLEGTSSTEIAVANRVGEAMKETWDLPPETYVGSEATHRVSENPYVFGRNLLANRLFPGPTVFIEGPYMNHRLTYERLQAGDFDGVQEIEGRPWRSLFREFADLITAAVIRWAKEEPEPRG